MNAKKTKNFEEKVQFEEKNMLATEFIRLFNVIQIINSCKINQVEHRKNGKFTFAAS